MNDPLGDYMKKHAPPIPPAPVDEWPRILARTRERSPRVWLSISAITLAVAGLLAFVNLKSFRDQDAKLEVEDVIYRDRSDIIDRGAYGDWLWLADSVGTEGDD